MPSRLVTAAIIENALINPTHLLLVKRARAPFKDYWTFIGGVGAFEITDDLGEAVRSEVQGDIGRKFTHDPVLEQFNSERYEFNGTVYLNHTYYFKGIIDGEPIPNPEAVS